MQHPLVTSSSDDDEDDDATESPWMLLASRSEGRAVVDMVEHTVGMIPRVATGAWHEGAGWIVVIVLVGAIVTNMVGAAVYEAGRGPVDDDDDTITKTMDAMVPTNPATTLASTTICQRVQQESPDSSLLS